MPAYVYIWEYEVLPEHVAAFEEHYGAEGTWVELFRRGRGHVSTRLLRDRRDPNRFVTIDRWESEAKFATFRRQFDEEFRALDQACERLTQRERELGTFEAR